MPPPFPGMNPYFENRGAWHNFHATFPNEAMRQLNAVLGPNYYAATDDNVYIREMPDGSGRGLQRPDVYAVENPQRIAGGGATAAVAASPGTQEVLLEVVEEERQPFIEIRDVRDNRVVTVIELLSPSNKAGGDREAYLSKRNDLLRSSANLVEIDLLHGGRRMPLASPVAGDYGVLISRAAERPRAEWCPIALRSSLPVIPIPLGDGDAPAPLDLQAVVHALHDIGIARFMYRMPPDPALASDDAAWAGEVLAAAGIAAVTT